MPRRNVVSVAAALALLTLPWGTGCGGRDNPTQPGTTVKELDSGTIGPGGTYAHRFFGTGALVTYPYHCALHPAMKNVNVIVDPAAPLPDTNKSVSITGTGTPPGYSPASVTIRPGGKVTWTNNDPLMANHTVTSD